LRGSSSFERSLASEQRPLVADMRSDSPTLLIAFGGLSGRLGMPPFEFFKTTGELPVKRLFVRDLRQAWYHHGIPGYGDRIEAVGDSLRELISGQGVERLVVTGNSSGGYAAILFGSMLDADEVLCFSPQTILDAEGLAAVGDERWNKRLGEIAANGGLDPDWVDLRVVLPRVRRGGTLCKVYFNEAHDADRGHAERLRGLQGVRLYRFGGLDHYLVRSLRDSGALGQLLERALERPRNVAA
jgi:hypothetical protein